jgi:hypothetical protein
MTITQQIGALGGFSIQLADDTPRDVLDKLGFFGHVVVLRGDVDVAGTANTTLLQKAKYVGVLREKPTGSNTLEGAGMVFWLGDEDNKGAVLETPLVFTNRTLSQCLTTLFALIPSLHLGVVNSAAGTYTGTHQWETPRSTLEKITAAFGVEYRVNGDGTVDFGTQAQLYTSVPDSIVSARGAGKDLDLSSIGGSFVTDTSVIDYSKRVVLLGQTDDQKQIVTATAENPANPYKDLFGNNVKMTRMIADSGQTPGSAPASAQLNLNRFSRTATALKVSATNYEIDGNFVVGDNTYVYDPDNGVFDVTKEKLFRGEILNPAIVRVVAITWQLVYGHTVAFRTIDGVWIDLTRWVQWENGADEITVGDLPKTLTNASNPAQQYAQTAASTAVPSAPTGLTLTTSAVQDSKGKSTATISASWTAPTTNTDGSTTSIAYYLIQYRWQGRAPLWEAARISGSTSSEIAGLAVGLPFDVQVAAVGANGQESAWSATATITTAPDSTAPNPPADPTVTNYIGQLRIAWNGLDNVGAAMPPDFSIVEVHVSATSGFTPSTATLVSQLSTAGVAYATAPYGSPRFVKLVSVDNSGNRSAPSGQATGTTAQAGPGDISTLNVGQLTAGTMSADVTVSGRFATALTGARVEMNALGFQKFDTDGVTKLVSITGTEALLTGLYKSAATGRRIEIGASGNLGNVNFFAPDGTQTYVRAFTESTGVESIQMGVPISGATNPQWNKFHANSDQWMQLSGNKVDLTFGKASGFFIVRQTTNQLSTSGVGRFQIDGTNLTYWDASITQRIFITPTDTLLYDATAQGRFWISPTETIIFDPAPGSSADGAVKWKRDAGYSAADSSLSQQIITDAGFGALITYAIGGGSGRVEYRDVVNAQWCPIWAGGFVTNSSITGKSNVKTLEDGALAQLLSTRVTTYQRPKPVSVKSKNKKMTLHPQIELGLIAEEAPEQITRNGREAIDLYAMASVEWKAIQELHAIVKIQGEQLDKLRDRA